jgi:uncharacterized caspase-like protein
LGLLKIMRWRRICAICAVLFVGAEPAAAAEKRVALVIGNAGYTQLATLKTPINDAKLVAKTLREIGFTEVLEQFDLGMAAMAASIETFNNRANVADWAVIYYAGHGLQVFGTPYLAPVDAKLGNETELGRETIKVDRLLGAPEPGPKLRLVILDMPRANPFPPRPWPARPENGLLKGAVFVAYATQPGNVLSQSEGDHGAFALALARHIVTPGASLDDIFYHVRRDVMDATNRRQVVWTEATFPGGHQLLPAPR